MKKILVLGVSGMAGHMIYTVLGETKNYEIVGTTNSQNFDSQSKKLNIYDRNQLIKIIEEHFSDERPIIIGTGGFSHLFEKDKIFDFIINNKDDGN